MARRTPLHDRHLALGARMVDFGGFDMPLQYTSIREEHVAVRERAGLFDVCHMGEIRISGEGALDTVQRLVANDVGPLAPGAARYGVMCNERGGIVDDVIVYRAWDGDGFLIVVNAARREVDAAWIRAHLSPGATFHDAGDELGLLALQGPAAVGAAGAVVAADLQALRPFTSVTTSLEGIDAEVCIVSRTGYTGEDGIEVYLDAAAVPAAWDLLLAAGHDVGTVPAGLGARDTLRLEAGLRLYGQDMDEDTDPLSAGLGWTVKLDKGDFIGRDALVALRAGGPPRRMLGLRLDGRSIGRHGHAVLRDGVRVGTVTSGTYGFTVGAGIATALVDSPAADASTYQIDIRGTLADAVVVPLPFRRRPAPPGR